MGKTQYGEIFTNFPTIYGTFMKIIFTATADCGEICENFPIWSFPHIL